MIYKKRSEATEQATLIQWCNLNKCVYPELGLIFHVPNGGQRNKTEARRLKAEGVKAGVPDLFLPVARGKFHGLFIEMKYGNNKATPKQREWIIELNNQGYYAVVCNGFEEAKTTIESYIKMT
jgi:hypothetical protein